MKLPIYAAALFGWAASGWAETATLALMAGKPAELVIDSRLDDRDYEDPRGYLHHGSATRHFQRTLTLTNSGTTPLTGPLLVINGEDWSRAENLPPAGATMPQLFAFWRDQISHADSDAPGAKEPLALLNFWGYSLCGDTTTALAHLASARHIPARKIPLNGHVAAEYFHDNGWRIFDTDQQVCYLRLDNRTLAGAAELRADPFLARRTKVLGRYAPMDVAIAAFNSSLHEFVAPVGAKPMKFKTPPAPVRSDTLYPGEKMIVHSDEAPERAVGKTDLGNWGRVREEALRVVEFVIDAGARKSGAPGEAAFSSGYPILRAVNHDTGETFTVPDGQPTFEVTVKFRAPTDHISVYCQRAETSLPRLRKGPNRVLLSTDKSAGTAELTAEWEPPAVIAPVATASLADPQPIFQVQAQPLADQLWWQISDAKDFAFVPPNFDAVISPAESIPFDPLTATFFNPDQPYYFRAKVRHAGVWGEWSEPIEFRVAKPSRPAPALVTIDGRRLHLAWPSAGPGCDYLVFGSNRLDFLPEPFAAEEIVKMRDQGVEQSRPNKNLIAVVAKPEIELEPANRFYRIIVRRGGVLSVPGDLIVTPPELAAKLPPALVLQDRWQRRGETDVHRATEMELPPR